jgi:dethiobiotin synthetase
MEQAYFITGTDTEVGKTHIATALLARARLQGLSTAAVKPIASGAHLLEGYLQNEDARLLKAQCTLSLSYSEVNPVVFEEAIAPHIAAQKANLSITLTQLINSCEHVMAKQADFTVIEGAGGWRVPINNTQTLADVAKQLKIPVIMVVGMKLGCINHAILTADAIVQDGLMLAGWVANCMVTPMLCYDENLTTLKNMLKAPCLGTVPFLPQATSEKIGEYLIL